MLPTWLRRSKPPAPAPAGAAGFSLLFGAPARQARREVLIIGNCLAETMAAGLAAHPVSGTAFDVAAVLVGHARLSEPAFAARLAGAGHVFLQSSAVNLLPGLRAAAPEARFVLFPDLVMRGLWPFDAQSGYGDDRVQVSDTATIRHLDGVLARLRTAEPDKQRRLERYRTLDIEEARYIPRIIEAQARYLARIDETTEAGAGAFIASRLQTAQLFYNATHPAGVVFQELCAFVWRELGLEGRAPVFSGLDGWRDWSVPVHPLIARRLGLTWATEKTRYRYCTLGEVTWEEWVRAYMDVLG